MRDRFPLVMVGGLLLLGALGGFVLQGARRGAFADRFSTYRSEPDGARALYLLLESGGLPVTRRQTPLEDFAPRAALVLLGVLFDDDQLKHEARADGGVDEPDAPDESARDSEERGVAFLRAPRISSDESEALLDHVKEGGTVVYVPSGAVHNALLKAAGVEVVNAAAAPELRSLLPAQPTPWTRGVERVEARVQGFLRLPERAVPLLVDDRLDQVAAALVPYGQGRLIVLSAPELATNEALARADNAQLWRSIAREASRGGSLAFDEYHHGFTSERSMGAFAARYGLQFAAAQLLLGVLLWAASLRRLGRPREPLETVRLESADALSATSRLYREGRHFGHAATSIVKQLTAELAGLAGASPRSEPTEVAAALAGRGRKALGDSLVELSFSAARASRDADVQSVAIKAASLRSRLQHARTMRKKR